MTALSKGNRPSILGDSINQELSQISGMGIVRRSWLKSLGICTIDDLANTNVDTLEQQCQARGYIVSRSDLETWIEQAIALSPDQPSRVHAKSAPKSAPVPVDDLEDWESLEAERDAFLQGGCLICGTGVLVDREGELEDELSPSSTETTPWQSIASFEITVQTRQEGECSDVQTIVRHRESDRQTTWNGSAEQELCHWITEQLKQVSIGR